MNEIPSILEPKENVIYTGQPEYAPYMTAVVFGTIIAALLLGIGLGVFLSSLIAGISLGIIVLIVGIILGQMSYSRTQYAITNKRAIIQSGIIGRDFKSIDYDKMQNVSVEVGILGVMFKVGTIKIFSGEMETVNTGKTSRMQAKYDKFSYINAPYDALKLLQTQLSKRKEEL